jgi:hypothetical protein
MSEMTRVGASGTNDQVTPIAAFPHGYVDIWRCSAKNQTSDEINDGPLRKAGPHLDMHRREKRLTW